MPETPLDVGFVRSRFPALDSEWVFFDNGGGSQILQPVIDRITEYLVTSNVQHGASYEVSQLAGVRLQSATEAMATLVNAADPSEIVMGPSTSSLLRTLSRCLVQRLEPGDEVVVTDCDHEANIGPWIDLERLGVGIKFWRIRPHELSLDLNDLDALLSPKTRLVAVTHTSNVLGTINPIRRIADAVHERGALLCVDGVAYAPHRAIDVQAMEADFYAFSFYKTFGPHYAVLYGKREHLLDLPSQNHFFIEEDDIPYKFQPGGVNYELSYGMLGLMDYLAELADDNGGPEEASNASARHQVVSAFERISRHEEILGARLLEYLHTKANVRIIGTDSVDRNVRVPIISFAVEGLRSAEIVARVDEHRIGIRFGHFYSSRLIDAIGLAPEDGVVRVSMAHYNTIQEVDRLIEVFDPLL